MPEFLKRVRISTMPGNSAVPAERTACFLGFIAPLHDRSDVKKNVAAAPVIRRQQQPELRSARPEWIRPVPRPIRQPDAKVRRWPGTRRGRGGKLLHLDSCARLG